ncbi:unnamed protein product [Owenia fusiformis]|uniref:Kinesin-like protein n=1 Tax=Owenia fusiformis TaxID=6347 RepID=A0A8J1XQ08_OWEFU|nr:unnamed protein product [Owenia fusiformis]
MSRQRGKTPRKTNKRPSQTDPVEVYCRIRPLSNDNEEVCVKALSTNVVQLCPTEASHAYKMGNIKETQYTFQYVFDKYTSQKAMFDHTALPLVEDVLKGKNGLLFAYGITSSGKTHTMTGHPHDQGILPRCLDVLFNSLEEQQTKKYVFKPDKMNGFDVQSEADAMVERQRRDLMPKLMKTPQTPRSKDKGAFCDSGRVKDPSRVDGVEEDNNYAVFVSYIEIYNNYVYDLLEDLTYDPITGLKAPTSKNLREDSDHNMYVSSAVEVEVKSSEEALEVLWKGQKRRKVAHTALNTESSRSHSVFNIRLVQAPLDPLGEEVYQDKDKICVSQLSLVDLAGSERTNRTNNEGSRLREAGNINQSLMVLRTCIELLRENQKFGSNKMVPYRDSRLTHLFKNYFDGEGKVRMVVCVNPAGAEYDETVHVMRFAELTQEVQIARPQQVRFDIGLTPGRRRMNQQYKEKLAKMKEDGLEIPTPERMYSMGPPFPLMELFEAHDNATLLQLAQFLHDREKRRASLVPDLDTKQDQFRNQLMEIEEENVKLKGRLQQLESMLGDKDTEITRVGRRIRTLEKENRQLQSTAHAYEQERRELNYEVSEKDSKLTQLRDKRQKMRNQFEYQMQVNNQQWHKNMTAEKNKIAMEAAQEIAEKEQKLELLKSIVNNQAPLSSGSGSQYSSTPPITPKPRPRTQTISTTSSAKPKSRYIPPARSEPDLSIVQGGTQYGPKPAIRGRPTTRDTHTRRGASPPAVKPKPVVNPRYHRRSRSSHADIWIDHQSKGTVETGTILQPTLKKKKSVSKLEVADTKEATRYMLTHQTADSDGDVATNLIKGDIIPTATGGSAVIFKDVETLKQTSPGERKRKSKEQKPEENDGEWTDVETRCRQGIGNFLSSKKSKGSRV